MQRACIYQPEPTERTFPLRGGRRASKVTGMEIMVGAIVGLLAFQFFGWPGAALAALAGVFVIPLLNRSEEWRQESGARLAEVERRLSISRED